ncbi:HAMP domain-containing protein [Paenibacillaceae bacterium]|nr:HAMP domain-containing protein [Paenibacillaceae bacterium]
MKLKVRSLLSSIRSKLLLSFIVFIALPIMSAVILYYNSSNTIVMNEVNATNAELLAKLADRVNRSAERMYQASHLIVNDPDILEYMQIADKSWLIDYGAFQKYKTFTKKMVNIRDFLLETEAYVAVFDFRGHLTATWPIQQADHVYQQMQHDDWFQQTKALQGVPLWSVVQGQQIELEKTLEQDSFLMMSRLLMGSTGINYGIVMIAVPVASLLPAESPQEAEGVERSELFLVDQSQVLYGDAERYETLTAGETKAQEQSLQQLYLINQQEIKQVGWHLTEAIPKASVSKKLKTLRNQSIFWLAILLLGCCILYVFIMLRIVKPLKLLYRSMSKVGDGQFRPVAVVKGNDELAMLSYKFNDMVANLSLLMRNVAEEQKRKEEAKFQALQAQVKPHFLFNILTSIKWSAKLSGAEHVSEMITSLGKLLSYSMKNEEELTELRGEIEFLHSYVSLHNVRFNNHVCLEVHVPEELLGIPFLKFTLQPIVENSIMHGRSSPIVITIDAKLQANQVTIIVKDNGGGYKDDAESAVNEPIRLSKFSGIGLNNIHERLKMHFGERYGLVARSIKDEGFEVSLHIPLLEGDRSNDQGTNN